MLRGCLLESAPDAARRAEYARERVNAAAYRVELMLSALAFSLCAVISTEFTDKDKCR